MASAAQASPHAPALAHAMPPPSLAASDGIAPAPAIDLAVAAPDAAAQNAEDIVVQGRSRRGDPAQAVNVEAFAATQAIDRAFVGPIATSYKKAVPDPFRTALRNFLAHLREPVVFLNYLLQLKPGKAMETLGRFGINTTLGVAGVIDVAKRPPFHLPRRRNSFANTLGLWGVKPGPFFFLPLIGPTTLRDLLGNVVDQTLVPVGPIRPLQQQEVAIPVGILSSLDHRIESEERVQQVRASGDPYSAAKQAYLDRRRAEIDGLRGRSRRVGVSAAPPTP